MKNRGIVVVPARLASTRLPNKLLLAETGRPLLAYVLENARKAVELSDGLLTDVLLACDDAKLAAVASSIGVHSVMTRADHKCGTTRVAEAVDLAGVGSRLNFIVNVQGDEPDLHPQAIIDVAASLMRSPDSEMATVVVPMFAGTEAMKQNPAAVKTVLDDAGRAIYFSRAPIPFDRTSAHGNEPLWHLHLGIYAYRPGFLRRFCGMPPSPLEERESLEQLRAISAGVKIQTTKVPWEWAGKGIDTPEDYASFVRRCAA